MTGRTIAIGDVHGCSKALRAVLESISPASEDTFIPLGDYIDRGPDSPGVLDQLIELQQSYDVRPLLGNHEAMLLMALQEPSEVDFWMDCGGRSTLKAYGGDLEMIPDSHVAFLRDCKKFVETEEFIFVHANYDAHLPLNRQQDFVLLWEHLTANLPQQHCSGKRAILGHTPQRSGDVLVLDQLVCIDTYCYGDGWLTALDVNALTIWQADKQGELRG